jgi:hypothetical protein
MLFKVVSFSSNFLFCKPFNLSAAVLGLICACTELTKLKSRINVNLKRFFIIGRFGLVEADYK